MDHGIAQWRKITDPTFTTTTAESAVDDFLRMTNDAKIQQTIHDVIEETWIELQLTHIQDHYRAIKICTQTN